MNIAKVLGFDETEFATNAAQIAGRERLDEGLREWIGAHATDECLKEMDSPGVVASKVFDVDDIFADPVFAEREIITSVPDEDLGTVRMQGVVPQFVTEPGKVWRTGPALGAGNDLVYREWLGLGEGELTDLRNGKVV